MKHLIPLIVLLSFGRANADSDPTIVVLGPAVDAKLAPPRAKAVESALAKAAVGKPGNRQIDTTCAADTLCLQGHGAALGAVRLLAVAAAPSKTANAIDFTFVLVDVEGKELIAKRAVTVADYKLARQLAADLAKFLDEGPTERAKALFEQGNQHYNLGEFEKALDAYKRAYRARALPAFLFNIAQCHRKLEQHKEAIAMYQSYLVGVPDAPNKAMVEDLIKESQGKLAAAADVDKAKLATEKADLERKRAEAERKAKEAAAVAAAQKAKVDQARIAAERARDLDKTYNRHPARKWTIVTGSLGAAAAIAGGVFGFGARSAQSAIDSAGCGDPDRFLDAAGEAKCNSDIDRGRRNARLANILIGSGGALLVGSVIVFAIDPGNLERPREPRAQVGIKPTGVEVVIRW